ncbi:hypothetical protein WUBG_18152 [Wuchereria bancrofti]|uniref:Uncharacterized protein n=1 Tax=Wuchereria bancrofti TaxID=6293 RepID=J9DN63_WUCBA|nr:hypothetical protein WUBG_18152 [Wuchereria bancrofti]
MELKLNEIESNKEYTNIETYASLSSFTEIGIGMQMDGTGLQDVHLADGCKVVLAISCDMNCPNCIINALYLSCGTLCELDNRIRETSRAVGRVFRIEAKNYNKIFTNLLKMEKSKNNEK